MPRQFNCKTCGARHEAPTGVKCNRQRAQDTPYEEVLRELRSVASNVGELTRRLDNLDNDKLDTGASVTSEPATVASLRADNHLQQQVSDRLKELSGVKRALGDETSESEGEGETPKSKSKKSGRIKTANEQVSKSVEWPQYFVYRGPTRTPATYDSLSPAEFTFGFLKIALSEKTEARKDIMLHHLKEIMEDSMHFSWENARNYHGILLQQFEQGRLSWADTGEIQRLRQIHARDPHAAVHKQNQKGVVDTGKGPRFCLSYQREACNQDGDHYTVRGLVKHVCAFCLKKRNKEFPHPESKCNAKLKATSHPN